MEKKLLKRKLLMFIVELQGRLSERQRKNLHDKDILAQTHVYIYRLSILAKFLESEEFENASLQEVEVLYNSITSRLANI